MKALLAVALLGGVAHADDQRYTCHEPDPSTKMSVEFKPDTSISDLAVWVAGFTCKAIAFDSGVAQHVTTVRIIAPKPLTPKQALQLFVDSVSATGLVVEVKPDTIVIKRNPKMPQGCPDAIATTTAPPTTTYPTPEDEAFAKDLDDGIKVTDDTHRVVKKSLVDKILANPMAVAKGARVVPSVKDGKPNGFKLYAIKPSSIYAKLGLANGDTLVTINGFDLTSADKALEVYTKVREATSMQVDIIRRGKSLSLYYAIK